MLMIVSFELAGSGNQSLAEAYRILASFGLQRQTSAGGLLPEGTAVGNVGKFRYSPAASLLRDEIWKLFQSALLDPVAVFAATIGADDCASRRSPPAAT